MILKMAYKVITAFRAKNNIRGAFTYYEKQKIGLGKRFLSEIRKTKKHISKYPFASSITYNHTVIVPINVFPYGIQILISEELKTVIILSVYCFKQNPDILVN